MASKNISLFQGWEQGGPTLSLLSSGMGVAGGTIVGGQYGRYGNQFHQVLDSTGDYFGQFIGTSNTAVGRTYFATPSLPVSQNIPICGFVDGSSAALITRCLYARILPSGQVEVGFQTTNPVSGAFSESSVSTNRICAGKWQRIDIKLDSSANPWVANWQLNGVAQAQITHAAAAVTWTHLCVGNPFSTGNSPTVNLYTDDSASGITLADYPYGPGRSVLLLPDGFESTSGTGAFRDESGGSFDSAWWQRVSDGAPPAENNTALASANDGLSLEMFGPFNTANHLTFSFEDLSLDASSYVSCVKSWSEQYKSSGSIAVDSAKGWLVETSTLLGTDTVNGTSNTTVELQGWHNGAGAAVPGRVAVPSGGWTEAKVNSLRLRWRSSLNGAGSPSTEYHGLAWLGMEVHISDDNELTQIGCAKPIRTLLGAGL